MANLREIIANATQGDLDLVHYAHAKNRRAKAMLTMSESPDIWVSDHANLADAEFAVAYSPEHVELMEAVIASARVDGCDMSDGCPTRDEDYTDCFDCQLGPALGALDAYRKEKGYE